MDTVAADRQNIVNIRDVLVENGTVAGLRWPSSDRPEGQKRIDDENEVDEDGGGEEEDSDDDEDNDTDEDEVIRDSSDKDIHNFSSKSTRILSATSESTTTTTTTTTRTISSSGSRMTEPSATTIPETTMEPPPSPSPTQTILANNNNNNITNNSTIQTRTASIRHDDVVNIESAIGDDGEQIIIIEGEEDEDIVNVHKDHFVDSSSLMASQHKMDTTPPVGAAADRTSSSSSNERRSSSSRTGQESSEMQADQPIALPLRPIIRSPYDDVDEDGHQGEMSIVYAEQHSDVQINCEVDMDIATSTWFHDGQVRCI